ncbi:MULTISPECIES: TetR/AcrR family transcriptional regulator [unclassified Rhizobium]|uniref:TetR/AcrR family transcriptional regulator n=1 Tax=unclassified Rhizobium TaxID=2613769 RepID=UPI001613326A|nr:MULTISPECIES: TetR/AcrR family transcriptional regulator [unclassified Rhizobium]MBB3384275.1 AcrR family transcriptional regulator [Rhizobium sp. BK098]MBB3615976.1 AcrR family transcriptional regulator [Rhizobium sp. BK609]MBB3681635.1 AcrR family transcriptional regulator [Rhizobium sp. BK612]
MQDPRSNRERTEKTKAALIAAARALFVEKGYAETSTPEIVAAAGITRGALYHHYEDKRALFRAVVREEALAVTRTIEQATPAQLPARDALIAGSNGYLDAMRVNGRTRLLLIEGPTVLGFTEMKKLDEETTALTLRQGLQATLNHGRNSGTPVDALADILSAAFDRAALAIDAGGDADRYRQAIGHMIERIAE